MAIKISLENQNTTIVFLPVREWEDEEVIGMTTMFFARCSQCLQRERILGADRVSERFQWQSRDYVLHFESYSQSVWIELLCADTPDEPSSIADLYHYISQQFKES